MKNSYSITQCPGELVRESVVEAGYDADEALFSRVCVSGFYPIGCYGVRESDTEETKIDLAPPQTSWARYFAPRWSSFRWGNKPRSSPKKAEMNLK